MKLEFATRLKQTAEVDLDLREDIRKLFRLIRVKLVTIKGATPAAIRSHCGSRVPMDDKDFAALMESLQFDTSWSDTENSSVVHDKVEQK